jgi:hypothetical protein
MWINVDSEGHFLLTGFTFALRTMGKTDISIGVEKKVIERRQVSEFRRFVRHKNP